VISASILKYFVRTKLSAKETTLIEKEALLEEIYELIRADYTSLDIKEVLGDSIKLVILKNVFLWAYRGKEGLRGAATSQVDSQNF
jgi:hypothetical protein